MFTTLPELHYPWVTLRQLCGRLRQQVPAIDLAGLRVTIQSIFPDYLPGDLTIQEHTHSSYEAHLILSGEIQYLSGFTQRLGPGHLFILPPRTPHAWRVLGKPCIDLNFSFLLDPEIRITLPDQWPVCSPFFWEFALLLQDVEEEGAGWRERSAAHLTAIVSRSLAVLGWPEQQPATCEESPQLLAVIEQFLLDHLDNPLTLDDVAAAVGLGRRSLTRYFRRRTGISVMEYLRSLRLQSAVGLLMNTDLTIAAIGRKIGMPEASYFCRCFRQHTGLAPQEYRKANLTALRLE